MRRYAAVLILVCLVLGTSDVLGAGDLSIDYQKDRMGVRAQGVTVREFLLALRAQTGIAVKMDDASYFKAGLSTLDVKFGRRPITTALDTVLAGMPYKLTTTPDGQVTAVVLTMDVPRIKGVAALTRPAAPQVPPAPRAPVAPPALAEPPAPAEPEAPLPPAPVKKVRGAAAAAPVTEPAEAEEEPPPAAKPAKAAKKPAKATASAAKKPEKPPMKQAYVPEPEVSQPIKPELAAAAERLRASKERGVVPDPKRPGPYAHPMGPNAEDSSGGPSFLQGKVPEAGTGAMPGDSDTVLAQTKTGRVFLTVGEYNGLLKAMAARGRLDKAAAGEQIERAITLKLAAELAAKAGYGSSVPAAGGAAEKTVMLADAIVKSEGCDISKISDAQAQSACRERPGDFADLARAPGEMKSLLVKQRIAMERWADRVEAYRREQGITRGR